VHGFCSSRYVGSRSCDIDVIHLQAGGRKRALNRVLSSLGLVSA